LGGNFIPFFLQQEIIRWLPFYFSLRHILYLCSIIIFGVILSTSYFTETVFASPTFPRQEIRDDPLDWIYFKNGERANGTLSSDILIVDYFSDGKFFNSTIWVAHPIRNIAVEGTQVLGYGVLIDIDSDETTGAQGGIDYNLEISNADGIWTQTLEEWTVLDKTRILQEGIVSPIFNEGKREFISLSFDLDSMGSPDHYKVAFYAFEVKDDGKIIVDFTNWLNLPPPEILISPSPNPVVLRPGEEIIVEILVESKTSFKPLLLFDAKSTPNIKLKFVSNQTTIEPFGKASVPLHIKVGKNAAILPRTIPIIVDITYPAEFVKEEEEYTGFIVSFKEEKVIRKFSSVSITVQEPITEAEKFNQFWDEWGKFISWGVGLTMPITYWVARKIIKSYKTKKSNQRQLREFSK